MKKIQKLYFSSLKLNQEEKSTIEPEFEERSTWGIQQLT